MLFKLTTRPQATHCPAKILSILFSLAVMGCVIGLTVGQNVSINACNFCDNELNFSPLLPNTIDTNDTTDAAYNTSNFINSRTKIVLNYNITFDFTAILAVVATAIRVENKNVFDCETQSLHITHQPAFVFNNIDNGLRESGVVGYVHNVILDGIAFDWDVDKMLECYVNENFYSNNPLSGMCTY